ncbi:MAG: hypothetical protein H6733_01720 [Alphaproteobacteria bacterium]|nr:hypothetical protein [Alphaproteobacteria bacterium]
MLPLLLALAVAVAGEPSGDADAPRRPSPVRFDYGGHVKVFGLAVLPTPVEHPDGVLYELLDPLPREPVAQAFLDGRLNLSLDAGTWFHAEAAHAITTSLNADSGRDQLNAKLAEPLLQGDTQALLELSALGAALGDDGLAALAGGSTSPFSTGVGRGAPQAFPLTWTAWDDPARDLRVQGRTDRLLIKFSPDSFDLTIGRQPVTFGHGTFFTPLDLVSPFSPATIDSEYKPGVDAIRADAWFGMSGQITVIAAYTGSTYLYEPAADGETTAQRVTGAAYGQTTFGVTDVGLFYGFVRGDHVVGATFVSGVGPVGLHGDAAVTFPRPDLDEPVFFRGVLGVDGRPTGTTTLAGEVYVQSFGTTDPSGIFEVLGSERALRGEVWQAGLVYAGLSVSQEITPLLIANLGVIANCTDPSFLLLPSVSWSVAANADLAFGGYVGLGRRPEGRTLDLANLPASPTAADLSVVTPRSELGTYPATLFVQARAYF